MFVTSLPEIEEVVQTDSGDFPDSYEDLIAEMHRFLDRLVAESAAKDTEDIFMGRDDDV